MSRNPDWRYVRVYIDVPVKGDIKDKDVVWGVQSAIDEGHHHIKRRSFDKIAYGKIQVKSAAKVEAFDKSQDIISFLEEVHGLHTSLEILYIVDGYQVTIMQDDKELTMTAAPDLRQALTLARLWWEKKKVEVSPRFKKEDSNA